MGNNTLMFKVGIADIKAELDKHKKEIDSWVNSNPIKLKVQLEDGALEQLATKLKAMGATFGESNAEVKKLQEELAALKAILNSFMNGAGTKESPVTNELRVMTKGAETAMTAMNQLSTIVNEAMSGGKAGKGYFWINRIPQLYEELLAKVQNRMTSIGSIMSKGFLPSGFENGKARSFMDRMLSQYEQLEKGMEVLHKGGFIDFHNIKALNDVFQRLETEWRPLIKQADDYNKKVEKQAQDVAKYEQQKVESIRKAEERGEKERAAARAKEEKEYEKFWQNGMKERERAAKENERAAKREEQAQQRSIKAQNAEYKVLQQNTKTARQEAERLVMTREKLLRSQATNLGKILSGGKEKLDTYQYEQVRQALRAIREELLQIQTAKQRGGLSTQALFGLGSGTQDFSGLISAYQHLISGKQQTAEANTRLTSTEQQLANAIKNSTDHMRGQSQVISDLKMMAMQYLSVWGAQSFVNSIIETGGLLEQQRLSLSAILGDMGKATTLFEQIKTMALKSPFGVVELDKMSKQLSAYSFEYEELFDWTKRLADISAATGTSVDRLALALGHVRSEGALSGYTLRQFAMANVPVLRMLSENLGISSKEVRERVKKKEISAEDVQDILKQLTEDGGMFANAQETMSEALNAKFKNLRDAFDIMYGEIAESGVGDELKNLAVMLTNGAKHWERLTKDILMLAAAFGTIKIAMYLYNSALGKETAATLRSAFAAKEREVANLKLTKSYRALTIEEQAELNMQRKWWSFGSKLNSRNLMVLLSTKKLTVAQLERAVAMGKVSKADAIAAMNLLKLNTAQMQSVKVLGFWGRIWQTIANGARMAGLAVKSFLASVAPLLAFSAVFELWNRRSEQEEAAKTMSSTMAGVGPGREAFDLRGSLTSSNKLSEEALKSNIEEMKNALEAAGVYTDELKKQVDQIEDTAKKYDLLKTKIGEVADKYEEMKVSQEKMLNDAWDAGGGWFTDNMATDAKDYDAAFAEYTKALTVGSKQIKNTLRKWMEIQGLWNAEFSELTGKQLLEQLSEQDANRFLANGDTSVYRGRGYDKTTREALEKIAEAKQKVGEQLEEMKGDQGKEFAETLKAMYEEAFNIDLDKLEGEEGEKQKIAFDKWLRETIGRAEGLTKEAKEALRNIVIGFTIKLVPQYVVEEPQTPQEVIDQQIGNNKWLSGFFGRQNSKNTTDVWTVETAKKEVKKYQKLFGDISLSNLDTAPKKLNSLLDGLEETKKNLQNTLDNGLLSKDEQDAIQKQLNETTQSIELADKALADVGGKRKRKGDKSGKKNPDTERAKAVREQVRVIKEAADAFQYWRDKVGDKSAWEHVQSEFGDVLTKIGITADNIEDVRSHLKNIPLMKEYQAITDQKVKTEIDKEIAKDNDQYIRKDFERDTEKWASALTRDLDELTRKWEIFNSVVTDTGDRILATRLSGISPGTTPAALKRSAVASFAGARIDFDSVLLKSDEEIDRYVESLGVAEEKIKAVQNGLKDWKKAQEELIKSDIQNYAKWLGSLVDLESIRMRNQEEYNRILEETNRLLAQGIITQEEAEKRRNAAATNEETKNWQATTLYSSLYNNSRAMAEGAFYEAYNREMASLNDQLKAGTLNMNDYADKVGKLNKIAAEFRMDGFLGINGGAGAYLSGGYQGLIDYHRNRAAEMRKNNDEEGARQEEETAESMEKAQKAAEQLTKVFQDLSSGADMVANLFDALGMEGAANAFGDAAGVLGGAASGAQSLSALGPWGMAVGGAIGGLTSIFQLSDKNHERRIQELKKEVTKIDNTLNTIKALRERELGYDSGSLRSQMAAMYNGQTTTRQLKAVMGTHDVQGTVVEGMKEYYSRYSGGNGYSQEYNALVETRKKYMEMYDEENDKKKKSEEALEEYKTKIAELDEQIMYFTQDLANEGWGIDIKGWADQISDSLWTAFENGEDALEAFHKTAKDIISDVAKRMMTLSLIEPALKRLQYELFGKYNSDTMQYEGKAIKYDSNGNIDMQASEQDVLDVLGKYFGEGGEMEKNVEATEMFYKWVEKITGMDLSSDESKKSTSTSIKNITESTADLLASYLNAVRASVSKIEFMDAEYYPKYLQLITSCNLVLVDLQTRAKEIADSNAAIERNTRTMADLMNGLKNKTWKLPIA